MRRVTLLCFNAVALRRTFKMFLCVAPFINYKILLSDQRTLNAFDNRPFAVGKVLGQWNDRKLHTRAENVFRGLGNKKKEGTKANEHKRKVTMISYMHKISHGPKKIGERHGAKVAFFFSALLKFKCLCQNVNTATEKSARNKCEIKHADVYLERVDNAVYKISFRCAKSYTGQTGHCINIT